jgi:hypothetical protein
MLLPRAVRFYVWARRPQVPALAWRADGPVEYRQRRRLGNRTWYWMERDLKVTLTFRGQICGRASGHRERVPSAEHQR